VAGNALTADTALTANTALTADSLSGVLGVGSGGTGTSTVPTFGKILMGNGFGGYDLMSTSSMNIMSTGFSGTTDNVTEGLTNLYYHNSLVNSYINGSSTIAKLYTANTWNALQTFGNNISLGGAQLNMGALALGNLMSYNGTNW